MSAVPFSGGSSLEANFAAPYGGMSIDFTHMDSIIELHADEYVVVPDVGGLLMNVVWTLWYSRLCPG
jgi:D-lactate dehydrogenase (cytochrome)